MKNQKTAFQCSTAWRPNDVLYQDLIKDIGVVACVVEIGVHFGYSLFTFARDYPKALVIGVDNFSYTDSDDAEKHLKDHVGFFPNIRIFQYESSDARRLWADPSVYCDIDILHIDGDHRYESVKRDYDLWHDAVRPGGVIMFHDIHSFPNEVGKFFNELKGTKKTIDKGAGLGLLFKDA